MQIEGGTVCFALYANHRGGCCMPLLPHRVILAVGAVVDIALHSGKEPVSSGDLADRLHLHRRHLEPVLQTLVRKGILAGVRGRKGGYKLAKARGAISVYDISEVVKTGETEEPSGLAGAVVVRMLAPAQQRFGSTLKRITVEDLVRAARLQLLPSYKARASAMPEAGELHSTPKSY
jgi:Rrf2 family iron-sulfur cluster assembly transcriptional regulator